MIIQIDLFFKLKDSVQFVNIEWHMLSELVHAYFCRTDLYCVMPEVSICFPPHIKAIIIISELVRAI